MSGPLSHPVSSIVRQLLVDLGVGIMPNTSGTWPIYSIQEPDKPDNCITLYNTVGKMQGRTQPDGETQEFHGVQFRVRATTELIGQNKITEIATAIDTQVLRSTVIIGSDTYTVYSINRNSQLLTLGKDVPQGKRNLFTTNATVSVRQTNQGD